MTRRDRVSMYMWNTVDDETNANFFFFFQIFYLHIYFFVYMSL